MSGKIISGIYMIRNIKNFRCYIGSSVNIYRRWQVHRGDARRGKHHSVFLQRDWNKCGEESFKFTILEELPPIQEKIWFNEQNYIWLFEPSYNSNEEVRRQRFCEEYKKSLGERMILLNKKMAKAKQTDETIRRRVVTRMKLTEYQVHEIVKLYKEGIPQKSLAKMFKADKTAIWRIVNNKICIYPDAMSKIIHRKKVKISFEEVRRIRTMINDEGRSILEVANMYGAALSKIKRIAAGEIRKDVVWDKHTLKRGEDGRYLPKNTKAPE